jgi:all-trans-8'-apo-beta-carotenal 15,15'-oxygenase
MASRLTTGRATRWPARSLEPQTERDLVIERIDGQVPDELLGTFYRIGPGTLAIGGQPNGHWFDGDGMVCAFFLERGALRFRNRYVATPWYREEQRAGRRLFSAFANVAPTLRGHLRQPKNPANTNVLLHGGDLLALYEAGRPFLLDPGSLETRGEASFGGTLPGYATFSAHPHRDPATGALVSVGLSFRAGPRGPYPVAEVWEIDRAGARARRGPAVPIRHADVIHSVGVTARHLVVLLGPYGLDPWKLPGLLLGRHGIFDSVRWRPADPLVVHVADRDGRSPPRLYELPASFMIHVANAFEGDHGEVVVDAILHPDPALVEAIRLPLSDPASRAGTLTRLRLEPSGRVHVEPLSDVPMEFPAIRPDHDGRPHRYVYAGRMETLDGHCAPTSRLLKIDTAAGRTLEHDLGQDCLFGEPVLVPRSGARAEDDGWVLALGYDGRDHHSFLGILDARSWQELARLHLPFHVPMGLHAHFAPARTAAGNAP